MANALLDTNAAGLELIKSFEAFRAEWYLDAVGVPTIGYGTTEHVPGVSAKRMPGPISEEEATRLLERSLIQVYEPAVEDAVKVPLSSNQFSALTSFAYNLGGGAFNRSTLLKKLNRRDYEGAAAEFDRWVYAGGNKLRGLVRRRAAERKLFETPALKAQEPEEVLKGIEVEPMTPRPVKPHPWNLPFFILHLFGQL